MHQLLIKNGTIIDGTGKSAYKADVTVDNGKITAIGDNFGNKPAEQIIDAKNQLVVPGFIDIQNHSDSYWTLFDQPDQQSLVTQGITTIIIGNCGASLAPLASRESIKAIQKWHNLDGVNVNWTSFEEFCAALGQLKLGVNVGSLVGHATLRRGLVGDAVRHVTGEELKVMNNLLNESLDQGALGLSMGLVYAHEADSTLKELETLAASLKPTGKYLSIHLRSEEEKIVEAVDEALEIARTCQVPVKISHLKVRSKQNWHLIAQVMNKLENAYHQGLNISFDVYPYHSSWAVLYTYLPKWAFEGGRAQMLKRIDSVGDRKKILEHLRNQQLDYNDIRIATAQGSNVYVGRSIAHISVNQGTPNEETLLNLLAANNGQVIVFDHNLSDEQIELLLTSPLSMIATDGAGYSKETHDLVHPRCFGTMPRFLSMVRDSKLMSWERAIAKITSEPAKLLGINSRGKLAPEASADIVVFDPNKIKDMATHENPYQVAEGISHVVVNGQVSYANRQITNLSGQVIKR